MARIPKWLINYEGQDVTDEIAPMVTNVAYTDYVHGKSDEIEITLEDTDSLWRELWYPSEGDRIDLKIGYVGEPLLNCGRFEVDDVTLDHSPRMVSIRGLAVPTSSPVRTRVSAAYDQTTLDAIVAQVAARHSLEVVGTVEAIPLRRITQAEETDLGFLRRLAESYGYVFSLRADRLTFFSLLELEATPAALSFDRTDLGRGTRFEAKTQGTYTACEVSYLDPLTGKVSTARVEASGVRRGVTTMTAVTAAPVVVAPSVILRLNSPHRAETKDWQTFLASQGLYTGAIDGIFGTLTDRGTRQFQATARIGVDGAVGPITYAAAIDVGFRPSTSASGGLGSTSGNVLRKQIRVDSAAEAEIQARALLHRANRLKATGSLVLEGNQRTCAGVSLDLARMNRLSGRYLIEESRHQIARRGGYRTEVKVTYVEV